MPEHPPSEVFVVLVRGQWPLRVFEREGHAVTAYESLVGKGHSVRIWRCHMEAVEELELVREKAFLSAKNTTTDQPTGGDG